MTTLITICAIIQRVFGQNNRRQQPRVQSVVAYAHVSWWVLVINIIMIAYYISTRQNIVCVKGTNWALKAKFHYAIQLANQRAGSLAGERNGMWLLPALCMVLWASLMLCCRNNDGTRSRTCTGSTHRRRRTLYCLLRTVLVSTQYCVCLFTAGQQKLAHTSGSQWAELVARWLTVQ